MGEIAVFAILSKMVSAILIFPGGIIKTKLILKCKYIFFIFGLPLFTRTAHPGAPEMPKNRVFCIFLKICSLDFFRFLHEGRANGYMQHSACGILPKILICVLSALKVAENA